MSTVERTASARFSAPKRRQHGREVAAVAAGALERALEGRAEHSRPGPRRRPLEVVRHGMPAVDELVHPVERVAARAARREPERGPALRRVAEEVEDGGHRLPRVT